MQMQITLLWLGLSLAAGVVYRLGPGDVIDVAVFEVEELSGPVVVAPDGTVTMPLVGAVPLAGLTTAEAAERLRSAYGEGLIRDPQISIAVREYRSQPVSVLGAVAKPDVYQLRGPRRLADVLALAGGLTAEASGEITILRPRGDGDQVWTVSARDNPWDEAHDTVRASKAGVVYVVGEVGRAGGFPLRDQEPISVLKALSLAGGLGRTASARRARIIRTAQGFREEIPVQVGDILDGRVPDVPLVPGDVLFIPNSRAKGAAARAAEAAIQMATGVIIWRR